jgi:hypothetical protein
MLNSLMISYIICSFLGYFNPGNMVLYLEFRSIIGIFFTDYRLVILEVTTPFEIGGNFKPDENFVLIAAVPDTKTGINQTLTVPNPDFVRSHRKYRDRYVVIVIINKY